MEITTEQIRKAIQTNQLSQIALLDIGILIKNAIDTQPQLFPTLIKEIIELNKPIRQRIDEHLKEMKEEPTPQCPGCGHIFYNDYPQPDGRCKYCHEDAD